jgi:hypothetical protein
MAMNPFRGLVSLRSTHGQNMKPNSVRQLDIINQVFWNIFSQEISFEFSAASIEINFIGEWLQLIWNE